MHKREGFLVVSLIWILFSVFGMLPAYWSGCIPTITDAFFETMSGFSTTGATIIENVDNFPKGLMIWRCMQQWLGGMGIVVLSLAILPLISEGGMSLFSAESTGPTKDKIHSKISFTAKVFWGTYIGLTALNAVSLWLGGMGIFDAVCHALTTLSTGGFSTKSAGLEYWDSTALEYITMLFMFLGGTNFTIFFFLFKGQFKKIFTNEEFKYYILTILFFSILICGSLILNKIEYSWSEAIKDSLFYVISMITTTGQITVDFMKWPPFVFTLLWIVMLLGASSGSTSGGIKITRIVLLVKNSYYEFKRLIHPNAVLPIRYNGQIVQTQIINNVLAFVVVYMVMVLISTVLFTATGLNFEDAFGASASALGNVGPSIGTIGTGNFSHFTAPAKWLMSFLMLVGRLELFTVLILLTPSFWKK
jgi:trk system potassium uptake protein TrkH